MVVCMVRFYYYVHFSDGPSTHLDAVTGFDLNENLLLVKEGKLSLMHHVAAVALQNQHQMSNEF